VTDQYWLCRHCGLRDPSWSELHNFTSFMSVQLEDCEKSVFCKYILSDDLPGFKTFVVRFMLRMSKVEYVRLDVIDLLNIQIQGINLTHNS
jgi:hypothetical protein